MMKKIICLLAVLLLSTLHTVKVDAEFISHKNMVHIEKISSACVLPLLHVAIKSENSKMFYNAVVWAEINVMANMALKYGYEKDKKSSLRMMPSVMMLAAYIALFADVIGSNWADNMFCVSALSMAIKEATDIYSLVVA